MRYGVHVGREIKFIAWLLCKSLEEKRMQSDCMWEFDDTVARYIGKKDCLSMFGDQIWIIHSSALILIYNPLSYSPPSRLHSKVFNELFRNFIQNLLIEYVFEKPWVMQIELLAHCRVESSLLVETLSPEFYKEA